MGKQRPGLFQELCHLSTEAIGFGTRRELALHLKMPDHARFTSLLSHFVYVCVYETFLGCWLLVFLPCATHQYEKLTTHPFSPTPHTQHAQFKHLKP